MYVYLNPWVWTGHNRFVIRSVEQQWQNNIAEFIRNFVFVSTFVATILFVGKKEGYSFFNTFLIVC